MYRKIQLELNSWMLSPERKILFLRGARQVGKTYSIRHLAKNFANFLEVNFEEESAIHTFFEDSLNPKGINEKLAAYFGVPIVPQKTLLFLCFW